MLDALDAAAEGPAGPHADELMLFGQFVGLWDVDVSYYPEDGTASVHRGEWSWGWILGGRAIQDVYTVPPRAEQERDGTEPLVHGTTVRIYDPSLDAWRIVWASPIGGVALNFIARERGDEIVLEGSTDDGSLLHWIFSDVGPSSYHWRAVTSGDGGQSWRTRQEMVVRRR